MARYRGPRLRLMRAVGMNLPGLSRKTMDRRSQPPGMKEGQFRRKKSEYGTHLIEKQKLRFNYGITERYLRRVVLQAFTAKAHSGHKLLELLESRLDSVVFRAGFASSIAAARQLVGHNHVHVNGKRVNIASFQVRPGQAVTLTEKASKMATVIQSKEAPTLARPAWLDVTADHSSAKMITAPDRDSFPFPIEVNLIVEFYAKRVKR